MELLFKLTDENYRTHGDMAWTIGKTNRADGEGKNLCSDGVLHAYRSQLVTVFLNPIHANFKNPRMLLVKADIVAYDILKVGSKEQTPVAELDVPSPTTECRVIFAILCGLTINNSYEWKMWAWNWIDGTDRTKKTAYAAAAAAYADAAADADADAGIDLEQLADMAFHIAADGI